MRLQGKSLVIIGGTTGLGLSAAREFILQGASVVVVGRNAESVDAARRHLGAENVLMGDACDPTTAAKAIEVAFRTSVHSMDFIMWPAEADAGTVMGGFTKLQMRDGTIR